MTFKLIVAGTRTFTDYNELARILESVLERHEPEDIEIVSGTARGVDQLGERYAEERGCGLSRFPADWNKYGKSAGYRRNAEMAKYADALFAVWDGESRGTKHMIDLASKERIDTLVWRYDEGAVYRVEEGE